MCLFIIDILIKWISCLMNIGWDCFVRFELLLVIEVDDIIDFWLVKFCCILLNFINSFWGVFFFLGYFGWLIVIIGVGVLLVLDIDFVFCLGLGLEGLFILLLVIFVKNFFRKNKEFWI